MKYTTFRKRKREERLIKNCHCFFTGIGNPRGFENPFLLAFGVLFFRWHNYLAMNIQADHKQWNDEAVFNEARKHVIAHHQASIVNYFLWWFGLWCLTHFPIKYHEELNVFDEIVVANHSTILVKERHSKYFYLLYYVCWLNIKYGKEYRECTTYLFWWKTQFSECLKHLAQS